ncbi:acyl-CoA dehydratase activase-related protein [Megasphaera paucivorans]|uniref:CoA-substrate-specific enzyme activase, putative n=1 Tax=Megasphaera paucivorans TaxID=349095 RepID=A0A1G9WR73_9FIRM|nr:2-hydroxyacyl-CoA dehydratase [Megasphaera paucivorans]SDM86970.1 CoA-substrate-specific enzyme activase, putative [Megasphaera paucivorans]
MQNILHIGIDIGSTTVKIAVLDENKHCLHACYVRHYTDIRQKVWDLLQNAYEIFGDRQITIAITGSGGIALADYLHIAFVQEVIAGTKAVRTYYPQSDVIIELGGEDAKITYLTGGNEHRMNGNCAGGTGAFIDQMATLLHTDAAGLNTLAEHADTLYPIAARCGVFAKTDVQALMNDGASKENVAASVFQSIVLQTITGLACGRPIRGTVCFLGGPLTFLPRLRLQFAKTLNLKENQVIAPDNAQVYVAIGAALGSFQEKPVSFMNLMGQLKGVDESSLAKSDRIDPLFASSNELSEFKKRHSEHTVPQAPLQGYTGPCYLGIDAGSTTIKAVLLSENNEILYTHYQNNEGSPLKAAKKIVSQIYDRLPASAYIAYSGITGYGEALLKEALRIDLGEVETIAHYQAAAHFCPDVDFILDIGGQDMKCTKLKDGHIEDILLNEACSSGCGSFLDTFAKSLNLSIEDFSKAALEAKHPIDLGSRCTVFMNSKVKQAQKEGATLSDISAGLSYSVIKNALYKVIKVKDPGKLGNHIVVQGGTFYNDAVLRAFEKLLGRTVIRPVIAGLMGAFGMALISKNTWHKHPISSTLLSKQNLNKLSVATSIRHCGKCTNNCLLTVNTFNDGHAYITGNRCERGAGGTAKHHDPLPNMYAFKYNRLFNHYTPLEQAPRGTIGIPRVLNMYEDYPFWFTFFTKLGYRVVLSDRSSKALFEKSMDTIPSDSACYPAKLVHGHIEDLLEQHVDRIFYPCIQNGPDEGSKNNTFNCPMVMSYPEVIRNNMAERLSITNTPYLCPFLPLHDKKRLIPRLQAELKIWNIGKKEIRQATEAAWAEEDAYKQQYYDLTKKTLAALERKGQRAIVLCGRPYHVDPEINHGIPELINSLGLAVLTEDGIAPLGKFDGALRVVDQWSYHSRLYRAAQYVAQKKNLELVELNSFGCGLDAIVADQVQEILACGHKIHTLLKIDEGSNLGAIRIRLRSLLFVMNHRKPPTAEVTPYSYKKTIFTKEDKLQDVILAPEMTPIHFPLFKAAFAHEGYRMEILPHQGQKAIDTGLAYIHNDACYPAIMSLGQIITALQSGTYDLNHTSVIISQTGGCCRATNYIGMLRKALADANLPNIPIISLNTKGLNKQPGFNPHMGFWHRLVMGMIYGDALQQVLYRTRPYEKVKGTAETLLKKWQEKCSVDLEKADFSTFKKNIRNMISEFDAIPMCDEKKPRIGLVGEIYVKFHPIANNHIVRMIEEEGGEIIVSGLADFFYYGLLDNQFRHKYLSGSWLSSTASKTAVRILNWYRKPYKEAVEKSRHFDPITSIYEIANDAKEYLSLGHEAGEGWFLTGDMIDLIKRGAKNIVCLQPFACLPNHVTGKGMIKTLKAAFPETGIVAIDYDPGASSVNQTNRLKLMLATTFESIREPLSTSDHPPLPFFKEGSVNASLNVKK